jgi:hypothetical protein
VRCGRDTRLLLCGGTARQRLVFHPPARPPAATISASSRASTGHPRCTHHQRELHRTARSVGRTQKGASAPAGVALIGAAGNGGAKSRPLYPAPVCRRHRGYRNRLRRQAVPGCQPPKPTLRSPPPTWTCCCRHRRRLTKSPHHPGARLGPKGTDSQFGGRLADPYQPILSLRPAQQPGPSPPQAGNSLELLSFLAGIASGRVG